MELKQVKENIYYISNPTNIGIIKSNESAILIEGGLDDSTAKKILAILANQGLQLEAVINTHAHSDHCGGNAYLQEETGARIYAPEIEAEMIQQPYLKPFYFFSGADPVSGLKNKFLMGRPSSVDKVIGQDQKRVVINDIELKIISLPGHSPNQIGIEFRDVLFCADSVFPPKVLKKHKISFYTDIDRQKEVLDFLKDTNYELYIPAHGEPVKNIKKLVEINLAAIEDIEQYILEIIDRKKTNEEILQDLCNQYEIELEGIQQYHLLKTTTLAYLSSLHSQGKLKFEMEDNLLYWINKND